MKKFLVAMMVMVMAVAAVFAAVPENVTFSGVSADDAKDKTVVLKYNINSLFSPAVDVTNASMTNYVIALEAFAANAAIAPQTLTFTVTDYTYANLDGNAKGYTVIVKPEASFRYDGDLSSSAPIAASNVTDEDSDTYIAVTFGGITEGTDADGVYEISKDTLDNDKITASFPANTITDYASVVGGNAVGTYTLGFGDSKAHAAGRYEHYTSIEYRAD